MQNDILYIIWVFHTSFGITICKKLEFEIQPFHSMSRSDQITHIVAILICF